MSEQAAIADASAGQEKQGGGKKKLLILLAIPLLLGGVGAGLWFTGILPGLLGMQKTEEVEAAAAAPAVRPPAFVDMPEIVANLNAGGRRATFIKLRSKLEVRTADDVAAVQAAMPRLQDMFTVYLREMRPEELRGSAGTHRLREELLARASVAAGTGRVTDVLFVEILVQ